MFAPGARISFWWALIGVAVLAMLAAASGCAAPAERRLDGRLYLKPVCDRGRLAGIVVGATGPLVQRIDFDPDEVCPQAELGI